MEDFIEEIYSNALARSRGIASICSHYFDEENVDLQYREFEHVYSRLQSMNVNDVLDRSLLFSDNDALEWYEELQQEYINSSDKKIFTEKNIQLFRKYYDLILPAKILEHASPKILIKIPETTITNEFNVSQKIYDLYFKINLSSNVLDNLTINRTTFQASHFNSSYMHSHVSTGAFLDWGEPCFGNGPIKEIVRQCKTRISDDLILQLCLEMQRYSQIESIAGGPYIKMDDINDPKLVKKLHDIKTEISLTQQSHTNAVVATNKNLLTRIIRNKSLRSFNIDGVNIVGTEFKDAAFAITKEYLLLLKETLGNEAAHKIVSMDIDNKTLIPYDISNGVIKKVSFESGSSGRSDFNRDGEEMFKFKGEYTKLKILDSNEINEHSMYILNPEIVLSIINKIYKLQIKTYATLSTKYTTKRIATI